MRLVWQPDPITFDVAVIADLTLLWGLEGVVLKHVGSASQRVPFINESRTTTRFRDAEIEVAAIDPGIFEGAADDRLSWLNEVSACPAAFEFCRRMDCSVVQVSGFARPPATTFEIDLAVPFEALLKRLPQRVFLAIKNEPWSCVTTAEAMMDLIVRLDLPAVRASWCPATSFRLGEDIEEAADRIGPVLSVLRCSDVRTDTGHRAAFGSGDIPWFEVIRRLAISGFDGIVSLELPRNATRTDGLRAASLLIRACREARAAIEK